MDETGLAAQRRHMVPTLKLLFREQKGILLISCYNFKTMKVNFYATLRAIVGAKTVDFDLPAGASLQALLDEMLRLYPGLRPELLDAEGRLFQHVHIFVNGRDASFLENGMETPVTSEDVIGVFPAVGGG